MGWAFALELMDLAQATGTRPSELLQDLEALAMDLTILRTARAARHMGHELATPAEDDLGIGRLTVYLRSLAER